MYCIVKDCESPAKIKDLCKPHYHRQWRQSKGLVSPLPPLEVSAIDLSYAAGILDGEGCIGIAAKKPPNERPSHYIHVTVAMTREEIPAWLAEIFGGSVGFSEAKPRKKAKWTWRVNNRRARRFLAVVRPYLKIKDQQAAIALQLHEDVFARSGIAAKRKLTDDEIIRRESLKRQISDLNQA